MIEKLSVDREKALLIGVIRHGIMENIVHEHLDELELLADTAGAKVIGRITQKVSRINAATFIGKGKAQQVIDQAELLGANLILFDDELSPAQIKNYHKIARGIKVLDRSGLILDIFQKHARTKEARTQVDLAYLEYLLPRLTRQWTHLERQMGGIGTRAGMGETQIEVDRRLIRTRIAKLKKELGRIEKERSTQGAGRKKEYRVALVGYTNAGKSTLFNCINRYCVPEEGSIHYAQKNILDLLPHHISELGIARTFQNLQNVPYMTLLENVLLGAHKRLSNTDLVRRWFFRKERLREETMALEVMSFLGIDNFEAKFLSGQPYAIQKLVEIARALISKPKLILLDEPAAGMNDQETLEISKIILEIRDVLGITVLLVEHDMNLVMKISDRICVLDSGKIIALGDPEKVKNDPEVIRSYLGDNSHA